MLAAIGRAQLNILDEFVDRRRANFRCYQQSLADLYQINGSIVLDLPDGLDADLDVRWLNGGLDSDLPIQVGRMGRGRATGRLGAGGATLRIETVNGSIRIR